MCQSLWMSPDSGMISFLLRSTGCFTHIFVCTQEQTSAWASLMASQEEYLFEYLATFFSLDFDVIVIKPLQVFSVPWSIATTLDFEIPKSFLKLYAFWVSFQMWTISCTRFTIQKLIWGVWGFLFSVYQVLSSNPKILINLLLICWWGRRTGKLGAALIFKTQSTQRPILFAVASLLKCSGEKQRVKH